MSHRWLLGLLTLLLIGPSVNAAEKECWGNCAKHGLFMPLGSEIKPGRKYARDRLVDVQHLVLDVTPDFQARTVTGTVTVSFTPIAQPLSTLTLDSVGLTIDQVRCEGATIADRQVTDEQLLVHFTQAIEPGATVLVSIAYHGQPEKGLHFRTEGQGYPAGDTQVWSQGEAEEHRYWFPCYDYPNERFTSEVICHVPEGMDVMSNGTLLGRGVAANGLVRWHWKQAQPHVNYLIALAAGYFHKVEAMSGTLPLSLWVPPSEKAQVAGAFRDTAAIMSFLQKEIGVPFPWDKYAQVYCHDFVAGGMENTSCSFMAAAALFPESVGRLDSLHGLDAHEMAHQWFGDLLTCRDWSHLWLNEGFASYYTLLYEEEKNGHEGLLVGLHEAAQRVIESKDRRPMVWRDYGDPMQQFDSRAYPKGAWVLHMLRSQLGKPLYQKSIRLYLERHRNGIVTTDDLQEVLEEVSGRSFDQFFDQWVHHGGVPEINATYAWDEARKQARLTIRQTQQVDAEVLVFRVPVPVRFSYQVEGKTEVKDFQITVSQTEEEFSFSLPSAPLTVRIDPDFSLLAKLDFKVPPELLKAQLEGDFESRWRAVEQLGEQSDDATAQRLGEIAAQDVHHAIRVQAVESLAKIGTPAARGLLISQLGQSDERVRLASTTAVASLYHPASAEALKGMIAGENNPAILAKVITSLAAWPQYDLLPWLAYPSYHHQVASAAVQALRNQNRVDAVPAIRGWLMATGTTLPQRALGAALGNLAFLSRGTADATVQPFMVNYLSDHRAAVRSAAARALGGLEDPRSLPALRGLAKVKLDPASGEAASAVSKIEASLTSPVQTQRAWEKVEALTRKAEDLEKKLEKLENRNKTP